MPPPPPPPAWDFKKFAGAVPPPPQPFWIPKAPAAPPPGMFTNTAAAVKPGKSQREELVLLAQKRSRRRLMELKQRLSGIVSESGVGLERLFRSFDTDRDGSVDYEEFRNGIQAIASSTPAAPQHAVMFYENMGNEAVECPAANAQSLEASGALTADTLVWAEGMAGWTPYGDCREQFVPAGGGNLAEQDIADMMILLDTDGDGSIDYQEFARWFGAGPPPPPMLPEVKSRLDAQAEAGGTPQEHLDAIQAAAEKRSRRMLMNLKREMGAFFKASGVALEQQFRGFDANGDGEIDHHEFRDGLMSLGANISEAQIADLITILDKDGDGTIDYQEFARWFGAGPPPPPMTPDMKQRAEMQASSSNPQEHLDAIQAAAEKRSRKLLMVLKTELSNVFKASGVSLERQFRGFDTDGDGAIDHDEFRNGLMSLGATISETQIYDLITILDKDGDGTIDYQEFARWFGAGPPPPPMLPQAKQMMDSRAASSVDPSALLREIEQKAKARRPPPPPTPEMRARLVAREEAASPDGGMQAHLEGLRIAALQRAEKRSRYLMLSLKSQVSGLVTQTGASLDQIFRSFDTNGDGEIDHLEFKTGLAHVAPDLTMAQIEDMITMLDQDGDGTIDYEEFARWFGRGPPPAPVLPEVKLRQEARESSTVNTADLLAEIEAAGRQRGISTGSGPPPAPKPYWIPDAPPPVPAGMFTNSQRTGSGSISASDMKAAAERRSRGLMLSLKAELSGVFCASGVSLERQFRGFDTDGNGAIDHYEFRTGLASLGAQLSEAQVDDLILMLDLDGDGSIDYQEFARWFGAGPPPPPVLPEVKSRLDAQAEAGGTPQEHLDAIQAAAEKRSRRMLMQLKQEMGAIFKGSNVSLEQQFRGFDANGDGEIDHHEFRDGLMSLGANISEAQIADLITILDKDGDGTIDYQEFARWFGAGPPPPPMTPDMKQRAEMQASSSNPQEHLDAIQAAAEKRSRKLLMALKTELKGIFKASGVSLERQFRGFDTDGDGAIDHDEFRNGLMKLGATISKTQIYDLITILDKDGDGTIDYQEFARWFGAGPPPPPMLPQAKQMMDSRAASSVDPSALLREIQVKAMEMGKAIGIEASQDDPSALLREIEAMAKRRMAARAQPSQGAFSGGGRDVFLAEIAQKAKQMGGLMGALGEIEAGGGGSDREAFLQELQVKARGFISGGYTSPTSRPTPIPEGSPPPSTRRAASDGVVGTVLAAMQTHPRNAKVQLAGCSAMWSLAYKNPSNRATMQASGAVPLLVSALQDHADSAELQAAGCAALASLAVDDRVARIIAAKGGSDLAKRALDMHMRDPRVAETANVLLANLNSIP